jgi:signal transduction histidine kinase
MNKSNLFLKITAIIILVFAVPALLLYYYDSKRVAQINNMNIKVLSVDNQPEIEVIKPQVMNKLDEMISQISALSSASVSKKFGVITGNMMVRTANYTRKDQLAKVKATFLKSAKALNAEAALVLPNGTVLEASKDTLKALNIKASTKFIQATSSKNPIFDLNFSGGTAEYFMPVFDMKDKLAVILYVKEDISALSSSMRKGTLSKNGVNMIVSTSGASLLNTDQTKENSENVLSNPDLKAVINEDDTSKNVKEGQYNNLRGLLGYKIMDDMENVIFVFTPYADYKRIKTQAKTEELALLDSTFFIPTYAWLIAALALGLFIAYSISAGPFAPVKRIVKALTHIDEESFQEILPKIKQGEYKKLLDSLVILRGRVKASEEKAEKLSQMSKELEEELSKEASKSDAEISELRDSIKISENNKSTLEEEINKLKNEIPKVKKEGEQKLEGEKALWNQKLAVVEKELEKEKQEIKKAQESKVPVEKENMRMDSVLMMNTELKGVLSVIKTYISSVLGGEGKITDAQQQFLGVVINKSARLERLINDLTELARLEKGEIKLVKSPVEINTVVQDVIFAIQPQADIKKVELKVNFSPTLPTGLGDSARLSNVTSQLLNQAIKVSPRSGQVIIETKEDGKNVIIRITDFGMSMPQSKSSILFVNFHGPETNAGPEFVNSGLRFPIIKAIVNNMGGDIWIESEIGKGKTFVISLPKSGADAGKQAAAVKPADTAKPSGLSGSQASEHKAVYAAPSVSKPVEPQQGFRIQRNAFDGPPAAAAPHKDEPLPTVNDLLNFDTMSAAPSASKKVELPGRDVKVPQELINKPGAPAPSAKKEDLKLPDELPPLPDLEDDKGSV